MPLASGNADRFVVSRKSIFKLLPEKGVNVLKCLLNEDHLRMEFPASLASESPSYLTLLERPRRLNSWYFLQVCFCFSTTWTNPKFF